MSFQFAFPNRRNQRGAFDQFIARGCKQAALRLGADPVPRSSNPLQGDRNRSRRTNLADQIHSSNVDTKFERCGRDHRAQFAAFQPRFGIQPQLARQASVMRKNGIRPKPFSQRMRDAF